MKGFVQTPDHIVDLMVEKLFRGVIPSSDDTVLDPGCGTGAFIEGIIRWCKNYSITIPKIVGIESDPQHVIEARKKFVRYPSINIQQEDFLSETGDTYHFIIGNPPYISITKLTEREKSFYRKNFETAKGRFDLYILFFEQTLTSLKQNGRLVLITPEKFLYVNTAVPLRILLAHKHVDEIHLIEEEAFGKLITYPTITTVTNRYSKSSTSVIFRNKMKVNVKLPKDGTSWLPVLSGVMKSQSVTQLSDFTIRISCGVATGADSIFIKPTKKLDTRLLEFAHPTLSGKQLTSTINTTETQDSILIPYTKSGDLIPEEKLGYLKEYLSEPRIFSKLIKRYCVTNAGKPWYSFHENPPLSDILRPKILCKDITSKTHFWIDREGNIIPRHSLYYIVPKNPDHIQHLCEYLNSDDVRIWLAANSQKAANGFHRLQSSVLKCIPIPEEISKIIDPEKTIIRNQRKKHHTNLKSQQTRLSYYVKSF